MGCCGSTESSTEILSTEESVADVVPSHIQTVPLSDYDLDYSRPIGDGSGCICYKCVEKKTGRNLCAKVFRDEDGQMPASGESIVAEFMTLRAARQVPNTVNVVALAQGRPMVKTGKDLVLILELGEGGDLFEWLVQNGGPMLEADAKILFRELLRTVHGLHEQLGKLHRNIQTENIILLSKDRNSPSTAFRLAGFSMAHDLTGARNACGSPDCTAPEIWGLGKNPDWKEKPHDDDGPALYGPAVDVWSIGCTMLVSLTALAAYNDNNARLNGKVEPFAVQTLKAKVSTECFNFVTSILNVVDPAQRPTIPELLKHPWIAQSTPTVPVATAAAFATAVPVAVAVAAPPPGFGPRATAWFSSTATAATGPPPGFDGPPGFSIKAAVTVPPGFEGSQITITRPDTKEVVGITVPPGYTPGMQFMAEVGASESATVLEDEAVTWSGPPGFGS